MTQEIVAVVIACLTTVVICLATLVVAALGVIRMPLITAIAILAMLRCNDASRGEENAAYQRIERKPHNETHDLVPHIDIFAVKRTRAGASSLIAELQRSLAATQA